MSVDPGSLGPKAQRNTRPEGEEVVRSLSVYHFDASGKIDTLDVYLQSPTTAGGIPEGLK